MHQTPHRLADLPRVVDSFSGDIDTYISQAEFYRAFRRACFLARVDQLFLDVDTYRIPGLQGRSPEYLMQSTLHAAEDVGLPPPSIGLSSGQGLYLKWFLEHPIPQRALIRWNAVERVLVDRLAHFGADPQARDVSRVLRMCNTVNSKTGQMCRVVHERKGPDGALIRYNFEYLARELLPLGRQELEARKRELATRERLRVVQGSRAGHLRQFSGRQLAWDRLQDLRKLAELRGGVREGERMKHLFWQMTFLLLSGATNSRQMWLEAGTLARELDSRWTYRSAELCTLYRKAREYEAGQSVEFEGRKYPSLYTPKNQTLIDLFQITDAEQGQLGTIISTGVSADRNKARCAARRRAQGAISREAYLSPSKQKAERALHLKKRGMSIREIAERLECSVGSVSSYLSQS